MHNGSLLCKDFDGRIHFSTKLMKHKTSVYIHVIKELHWLHRFSNNIKFAEFYYFKLTLNSFILIHHNVCCI